MTKKQIIKDCNIISRIIFACVFASGMQNASATEPTYALVSNQLYMYSDITGQIDNKDVCITTLVRRIEEKAVIINVTSNSVEKKSGNNRFNRIFGLKNI